MSKWWLVVLALVACAACNGETTITAPATPTPTQDVAPAALGEIRAKVITVDETGAPLPGMQPIATLQRNAFDTPLVRGPLTNAEGTSTFLLPQGQHLYVRAWDPNLRRFANNYYDVLPAAGAYTEDMTVRMLPSASLSATLLRPDGQPAAAAPVDIVLVHPTEGPWWPDKARTDAAAVVRFMSLPAGSYSLRITVEPGFSLEVMGVVLHPGEHTELGPLTLQ